MFELMLCSMFTLLPDYLYRRYAQGKRLGTEITLFSMWYELRWGITGCVMLTVLLITMIFYFHTRQEGRRALHARQLEAAGRRRDRQAQSGRGRCPAR
jgi:hypothetical protein